MSQQTCADTGEALSLATRTRPASTAQTPGGALPPPRDSGARHKCGYAGGMAARTNRQIARRRRGGARSQRRQAASLAVHRLREAHRQAIVVVHQSAPPSDNQADTARRMRQVWLDTDSTLQLGMETFAQERSAIRA